MPRIRVLVVEDSPTVRRRLTAAIEAHPGFELVGEAADGRAAIELCQALRPDVVTLDMMLPVMSGLSVTEFLMAYCPTPILVVSASTNRGEVVRTMDALAAGAVDVLEKPRGDEPEGAWEAQFLASVRMVARIRVITHPRARLGLRDARPQVEETPPLEGGRKVVALGASTGGPGAVLTVLKSLPGGLAVPVLVVIHIGRAFAAGLVSWLDGDAPLRVAFAEDRMPLERAGGRVLLAPPDVHLVVERGLLRLTAAPERHSCRPSVDVLFESMAAELGERAVACLLSGMGRDGAEGLLAIRMAGGATVAQDEATSVVFGMPREAIQRGAAAQVLALDRIGPAIRAHVRER